LTKRMQDSLMVYREKQEGKKEKEEGNWKKGN
jgi:hypothetical protein